ncbi:MAG: pyrroline-5-carboxylate reductase [Acidimicrobiaceae bacterium]|nr:pyrroline-5-carboxylate reductase [Acidimicrobiaceae bacterium]
MSAELVVIGGGRMGEALAGGLLAAGWAPAEQLVVAEASADRRAALAAPGALGARHPGLAIADPATLLAGSASGAVIAVKPGDIPAACAVARQVAAKRVLSVAAGVTIDSLTSHLGSGTVVLRAMPNTPALIGAGAAGLAGGASATDADLAWGEGILSAVGVAVRVPESALDAVTGLSGSGPAYVFMLAEALIDAGVFVGLARPLASRLAVQTLLGAARMLDETGESPEALRAAVTSPGGTTASGLRALEQGAVRAAVIDAVAAATDRSRELGQA